MASAGRDSTTARKSFPLPLWTADSELKGGLRRLLKSLLRAVVVITPITTSQHSGGVGGGHTWRFSIREEDRKQFMISASQFGYVQLPDAAICGFISGERNA